MTTKEKVEKVLNTIKPTLQSDRGSVELVDVKDNKVYYKLSGACQGCPSSSVILKRGITVTIRRDVPEIEEVLEVLPDGSERGTTPKDKKAKDPWVYQERIEGIKLIIAVASGKGGVGKSTIAVNLALAFSRSGLKVGLLDADIHGPSIPTMLGVHKITQKPTDTFFKPAEAYGLKIMSIGFFVPDDSAMIWRGPMVTKTIDQFIHNVDWGELDCMVIDLPPGTGDAQLTISQRMQVDGAVIVTTPSDVALIDARRGLKMFNKVNVAVLGIVENMSYFLCPHCNERTDIFSAGGGKEVALKLNTNFLGEIPLDPLIRSTGDQGRPIIVSEPNSPQAKHFSKLADKVWELTTSLVPKWNLNACHSIDPAPITPSDKKTG
ncbi:MAG: P-loop NTPase [Candidatus Hatepunaea meridiana]|nr:P-loop NTPase [Candidatus Hatepunaea meridiana]